MKCHLLENNTGSLVDLRAVTQNISVERTCVCAAEREIKNAGPLKGRVIQDRHFCSFRTLFSRDPNIQLYTAPVPYP